METKEKEIINKIVYEINLIGFAKKKVIQDKKKSNRIYMWHCYRV